MTDHRTDTLVEDPDTVVRVRLPTREDGLWIEFADGISGFVTWRDLKLQGKLPSLVLDSVRIDELGSAVEFDTTDGETLDVDGLAIKTLLDADASDRVSTWIQRSNLAVARRIRAVRLKSGLTQASLGKRAGMDQAVISKLERGFHHPRIDTLRRIAEALDLTLVDLLDQSAA